MPSPYVFDKSLADAAVEFFPRHLRLTTGEWMGKPFHLSEWQAHHTRQIFGWRRRSNGMRRYRRVRGWISKKAGKTEWFAGIGLMLQVADGEPTAEIFSHASNLEQASIVWSRARRMIELDRVQRGPLWVPGPFARLFEVSATALFCPHLYSSFKPISGDPSGKHGPSIQAALGDEPWEWPNGTLHGHLVDGMSSRRQPLDATFSSAGEIRTYGHELHEESLAILADPSLDPETYVFAYGGTEKDDWTDPDNWAKWNPNYPITPKHDFLVDLCRQAQRNPRIENRFKQFYCGIWTAQAKRWFAMHLWPTNTRDAKDAALWKKIGAELRGETAFGGLDLGSISDITALVWVFKPKGKKGRVTLLPRFFCPQAAIDANDKPSAPYKKWVKQGALFATPGNVTDYNFVEAQIKNDAEQFRVVRDSPEDFSLLVDRWNATQVTVNLRNEGIPVALFGQGFASMSAPSKEMERLYLSGALEHGNHPVLEWMFGNAAYRDDPIGNIKPVKGETGGKIDGVVAGIMGIAGMSAGTSSYNLDDWLVRPVVIG